MADSLWDDSEYPYHARYGGPGRQQQPAAAATAIQRRPIPWPKIRRWLIRGAWTSAAVVLLIAVLLVTFFGRAASRAWTIASLDERGAYLGYLHEDPAVDDPLPEMLRERLGPHWWSELVSLRYTGDGYLTRGFGYHEASADDVDWVARQCGTLERLELLEFRTDLLSGKHLANWDRLQALEHLELESNQLGDDALAAISKLAGLRRLHLSRATISNRGLRFLAQMPNLKQLTLNDVRYEASSEAGAASFESLRELGVSQSPTFGDAAIEALGDLPQLEAINFNLTSIGDPGFAHLVRRAEMRSVIVDRGNLTDASLAHLANFPRVGWLVLSGMPLTDKGLEALAGKEFGTLILDQTGITDAGVPALARVEGLEFLSLCGSKITGESFGAFAGKKLGTLDLGQTNLSKAGLARLAQLNCETLMLGETPLDEQSLPLFVENDSLTTLHIEGTQVSVEAIQAFYRARDKLSRQGKSLPGISIEAGLTEDPTFLRGFDPQTGLPINDPGDEPPPPDGQ